MSHTPGPWFAVKAPCDGHAAAAFYINTRGADRRSKSVAHIKRSTIQPCEANASLIAAAPELLQALELVRASESWDYLLSESSRCVILYAIAKARGES